MTSNHLSEWRFIAVMAAIFAGSLLAAGVVAGTVAISGADKGLALFTAYVLQFSLTVVAGALWLRPRGGVAMRLGARWRDAGLVTAGLAVFLAAGVTIEPLINLFPDHYLKELDRMIGGAGPWMMMTTVVAAPVLEELLFRGLVLEVLLRRWSAAAAVAVSAALFGAAHLPNLPQAVNAFAIACVMGYIFVLTGRRLVPVIVIHAANNALAYTALRVTGSQMTDTREMIGNDALYWAVYAVCAAIFVASMAVMVRRARNKTPGVCVKA
jgi:membrane protease YdiL (CAAX protease family)